MNDAHLHMLVNHFPIIGVILGLGILFTGVLIKNNSVKNTAYGLFIVTAVFAAFSIGTGDGAEAMVEDMPTVGKNIIHIHEEIAEKLAISLYLLGVISIIGIYFTIKKHSKAKLISFVAIVIAIIGLLAAIVMASLGSARDKTKSTSIKSNMDSIRKQAEIWYDNRGTYFLNKAIIFKKKIK